MEFSDDGVLDSVRKLPINHMAVVLLKYYGGLTIEEISNVLDVGTATVSRRNKEAIKILSENL